MIGVRRLDEHLGRGQALVRPAVGPRSRHRAPVGRRACMSLARSLGYRSLYVETWPDKMCGSYEMCRRLGFEETTKRDFHGMEGIVAMRLPLDAVAA